MAKRGDKPSKRAERPRGGVVETVTDVIVDADGTVTPVSGRTAKELHKLEKRLAAARKTGLPVIVSFSFDTGKRKDRTMTGITPEKAARRMTEEGADAVGELGGTGEYRGLCLRPSDWFVWPTTRHFGAMTLLADR